MDAWITSWDVPLRLRVLDAGGGPCAVFVHGLGACAAAYRRAIPRVDLLGALHEEGISVVAPDLPGHGASGGRRGHLPWRTAMAALSASIGYAGQRFGGPVVPVGVGSGGVLAFYAALEDERAAGAACHTLIDLRDVAPFLRSLRHRAMLACADQARALARRLPHLPLPAAPLLAAGDAFEDPALVRRWRRFPGMRATLSVETVVSTFLAPEDKPALEAMDRPVLGMLGTEDRVVAPVAQRAAFSRISAPVELLAVPGAGHMLPLEHPHAVLPAIVKWVRQLG